MPLTGCQIHSNSLGCKINYLPFFHISYPTTPAPLLKWLKLQWCSHYFLPRYGKIDLTAIGGTAVILWTRFIKNLHLFTHICWWSITIPNYSIQRSARMHNDYIIWGWHGPVTSINIFLHMYILCRLHQHDQYTKIIEDLWGRFGHGRRYYHTELQRTEILFGCTKQYSLPYTILICRKFSTKYRHSKLLAWFRS